MKRSMYQAGSLSTFIVLLTGAGTARAGLNDPEFRGAPNSVHAIFDWNGGAKWDTTLFETFPADYQLNARNPSTNDNGIDTTIILPNFIDDLPLKRIRLQLTFDSAVPSDLWNLDIKTSEAAQASWQIVGGSEGDSNEQYIDIEIEPNPRWEEITIFGDPGGNIVPGNLLRVEIDTISTVPEPATLALACAGGLLMLRKRRK